MTDQEKRLQRAQLQIDLEDAQIEHAHLREKAIRLADGMHAIATKIEMNAGLAPSGKDFTLDGELEQRLGPDCQAVMSYPEAINIVAELRKKRGEIYNLRRRQSELANPGGMSVIVGV